MKAISTAFRATVAFAAGLLLLFAAGVVSAQEAEPENPEAQALSQKIAAMPNAAINPETAQVLAKHNGCFRCHAIDKAVEKVGPNWKSVADRFRPLPAQIQPIIQTRLLYHLLSGETANFPDGHKEHHRLIHTDPPEDPAQIKNLVDWILSL